MSRIPTLAAVAALGLTAAACAPAPREITAASNPSLYSVHQPIVQRTNYVIDLADGGGRLSDSEAQRLRAWFDSIGVGYGDRIAIDEPQGYPSSGAHEDIARVAADYGLLLSDGAPVLNGAVQPGTIRVIASRATASVPGCPVWSDPVGESTTLTSANFGCASNANLAAMIANPEDLVLGQSGSGNGSATTASRAIRVYRNRTPTGSQPLPSTSTRGNSQ